MKLDPESGMMGSNEQVRIFSLPGDCLPTPRDTLRGMRAHPRLPARPGQRGADPALPPDAPRGPHRHARHNALNGPPPDWATGGLVGQSGFMAETLTMMAVHAHPDDEASSTGGVLAAYSAQGIRTVVVTCTNGEFGDAPGGVKPGQNGHDEQAVARQRLAELRESCTILGVTNLEVLGYHDSGMPEWDYKDRPNAFCNIPEADVAARISELIDKYRPQGLITYDDQGAYQHPEHVHASRSTHKAFAASGSVAKLYLTAMRGSDWRKIWAALRELGADVPDWQEPDPERQRRARPPGGRLTPTLANRVTPSPQRGG